MGPLSSLEDVIRTLIDQHEWLALTVLFVSSIIEYLFPPFPGDTVTLAGAVLVTGFGWSFLPVFGAVTAGSVVGSGLAFLAGQWLYKKGFLSPHTGARGKEARRQIARLVERFERHGEAYLVINRFLPGIRTFFFVAAGLANMRPLHVLAWSAVSAALWNLGIMGIGLLIGDNLDQLETIVLGYSRTATIVITVLVGAFITRWLWRRHKARRT